MYQQDHLEQLKRYNGAHQRNPLPCQASECEWAAAAAKYKATTSNLTRTQPAVNPPSSIILT